MAQLFSSLNDTFSFGKYKNQKISDVYDFNRGYINWCIENNVIELADNLQSMLDEYVSEDSITIPDDNKDNINEIDDVVGFVLELFSIKMSIDNLSIVIENGISINAEEEFSSETTVGLSPNIIGLFKAQRLSFRKSILENQIQHFKSDLSNKVSLLINFILTQKVKDEGEKLLYIYDDLLQSEELITLKIYLEKSESGFKELHISYKKSFVYDFHIFSVDTPKI